jgi:hypothetical protein
MTDIAIWDVSAWRSFLEQWSQDVIALLRREHPEFHSDLASHTLSRGSILRAPASQEDIASAERRLGARLPTSYQRFLQASNGLALHALDAEDAQLFGTSELAWLRDKGCALVDAWSQSGSGCSDEAYFVYGQAQDCVNIRPEYMKSALQLSDYVDSAVVLLNPQIVDGHGEWEAWDFGNNFPGAYRFRSFQQLMVGLKARTIANLEDALAFQDSM